MTLYNCHDWTPAVQLAAATSDAEDLAWSPDGACFVVWDHCLGYQLAVYTPEGECLATYSAYSDALGIKSIAWSPTGQLLVVGSFDQVGWQTRGGGLPTWCSMRPHHKGVGNP